MTLLPAPRLTTVADLLAEARPLDVPTDWWSWSGAHGGLVVALAAADAAGLAPDLSLRGVTAQLLAPVRAGLDLRSAAVHRGRTITSIRTEVTSGDRTAATVTTTFGRPGLEVATHPIPAPLVGGPDGLATFEPPGGLVPFARHLEVRPADGALPLSGSAAAILTAWIRLADEDGAPDPLRLVLLADALAPSLYATQTTPLVIPTVELSVHLRPAAPGSPLDDPWVLVRARTDWSAEGWVAEQIDLWDRGGAHRAAARQLRVVT